MVVSCASLFTDGPVSWPYDVRHCWLPLAANLFVYASPFSRSLISARSDISNWLPSPSAKAARPPSSTGFAPPAGPPALSLRAVPVRPHSVRIWCSCTKRMASTYYIIAKRASTAPSATIMAPATNNQASIFRRRASLAMSTLIVFAGPPDRWPSRSPAGAIEQSVARGVRGKCGPIRAEVRGVLVCPSCFPPVPAKSLQGRTRTSNGIRSSLVP